MNEPPNEFTKNNRKYKVIKKTKQGLYLCENEFGIKECFDAFDLGLIEYRGKVKNYNIRPEKVVYR